MNINDSFPSRWLKATDVPEDSDLLLTIADVEVQTVGQNEDAEEKPVVTFRETEKGLVLNKTNAATISGLYGAETDAWTGKKIALFATEVQFGSQMTMALRVRMKAPKASGAAPATTNGSSSNAWKRWYKASAEAEKAGLPVPNLDDAASDDEVLAAIKALENKIADATF